VKKTQRILFMNIPKKRRRGFEEEEEKKP